MGYGGDVQQIRIEGGQTITPESNDERIAAYKDVYDGCRAARFFYDAYWLLGIAMTEGQHWIEENAYSSSKGGRVVHAYPENYSPGSAEIRVTLNMIRPLVANISAMTRVAPEGWNLQFDPDPRDPIGGAEDLSLAERVWQHFLSQPQVDLAGEAHLANQWRVQTGGGLLKIVPDQKCIYGWNIVHVPNDRMIWDVAWSNPDPWRHPKWIDCAAWPASEVQKRYGIEFSPDTLKNLPKMRDLCAFTEMTNTVRSLRPGEAYQSMTPAVLLSEFFDDDYARETVIMHTGTGNGQMHVAWDGPNPLGFCPYLKLDFGTSLLGPWGPGIPHIVKAPQQIYNLVNTMFVRNVTACGAPRYVYEEGTITAPEQAFAPRMGAPLAWNRQGRPEAQAPRVLEPPQISQTAAFLTNSMPSVMQDMSHLEPVLRGETSKRGESRLAIDAKVSQAQRPFSAIEEQDFSRYQKTFTAFAQFLVENAPSAVLLEAAGPELRQVALDALQRRPRMNTRPVVSVPRDSIHPRTTAEKKSDMADAVARGAMSPAEYRYEVAKQLGRPLTALERMAITNASRENLQLLAGARSHAPGRPEWDLEAKSGELHDVHKRVHAIIINARHTMGLADAVVDETILHGFDHDAEQLDEVEVQSAITMAAQGMGQQGQAALEAETAEEMGQVPQQTPLGGAMAAPEATSGEYAGREAGTPAAAMTA